MDVYLRYCDASRSKDSAFYVARLSTQKLKDTQPNLSTREISYLEELSKKKQVVVFDDNIISGTTIDIAYTYFSTKVFPNQNVITLVNLNIIEELIRLGFDKELKEIDQYTEINKKHLLIKQLYEKEISIKFQ